jgi:hypothetical protein
VARPTVGTFRAQGTPAENCAYNYTAGASGTFSLPAGAYLLSVTAWATGGGATVQIGARDAIALPIAGSIELAPDGGIVGPVDIVATLTAGYLIEYLL